MSSSFGSFQIKHQAILTSLHSLPQYKNPMPICRLHHDALLYVECLFCLMEGIFCQPHHFFDAKVVVHLSHMLDRQVKKWREGKIRVNVKRLMEHTIGKRQVRKATNVISMVVLRNKNQDLSEAQIKSLKLKRQVKKEWKEQKSIEKRLKEQQKQKIRKHQEQREKLKNQL